MKAIPAVLLGLLGATAAALTEGTETATGLEIAPGTAAARLRGRRRAYADTSVEATPSAVAQDLDDDDDAPYKFSPHAFDDIVTIEAADAAAAALIATNDETVLAGACAGTLYTGARWTSEQKQIKFQGRPFHLKGTNWFGFETTNILWSLLDGTKEAYDRCLNSRSTPAQEIRRRLNTIASHGFNAVRLPLSMDKILNLAGARADRWLVSDLIQNVLDGAAAAGLVVMLDMHRLAPCCATDQAWFGYETWGNAATFTTAWLNLLGKFGAHPALFAIDLFNEPHGIANWGKNGEWDWYAFSSNLIRRILADRPQFKGLFFVEGIGSGDNIAAGAQKSTQPSYWWGEKLEGVWNMPISAGGNRVVYSPHVYGPSVSPQPYFNAGDFPTNLPAIWNSHFKWVETRTDRAVVIGEWGGLDIGQDAAWMKAFAAYMKSACLSDNFFWVVNPASSDTGGWMTASGGFDTEKLKKINIAQPFPSHFSGGITAGHYCFVPGAYANPNCATLQ